MKYKLTRKISLDSNYVLPIGSEWEERRTYDCQGSMLFCLSNPEYPPLLKRCVVDFSVFSLINMEEMIKVKKGQWYYLCCHEDLEQATEDFEEEKEDSIISGVYDSKEEAIKVIAENWIASGYPNMAKEALALLY